MVVVASFGQTVIAAPVDDGDAGAGGAGVDVLSNVDAIDLDLFGFTSEVLAPPTPGTNSSDEGLDVVYNDSSFSAEVLEVSATRQPSGFAANANVGATVLRLLGQELVSVSSASSSVECPENGESIATAEVADVDLGLGPVSLTGGGYTDASYPFESEVFTSGTGMVHLSAESGALVLDGVAIAVGLVVILSVDGEPVGSGSGVVEGAITGVIVLAQSFCVSFGDLANTGSGTTLVILLVAVMFIAAGGAMTLKTRRR